MLLFIFYLMEHDLICAVSEQGCFGRMVWFRQHFYSWCSWGERIINFCPIFFFLQPICHFLKIFFLKKKIFFMWHFISIALNKTKKNRPKQHVLITSMSNRFLERISRNLWFSKLHGQIVYAINGEKVI